MSATCFPQKQLERSWDAAAIHTVAIESDDLYTIKISSEERTNIQLSVSVEGETYQHLLLKTSEVPDRVPNGKRLLQIETGFTPFFQRADDKLAAHKVLAVEMVLVVPEGISVQIESKSASVHASGKYGAITARLETGRCVFSKFSGNASLQTKQGDIEIAAHSATAGSVSSIYGKVKNHLPDSGRYTISAESVWGNISLTQTE